MNFGTKRGKARVLATAALALAITGAVQLVPGSGTVQAAVLPGAPAGSADGRYTLTLRRGLDGYRMWATFVALGPDVAAQPSVLRETVAGLAGTLGRPRSSSFKKPLTRTIDRYLGSVPGEVAVSVRDLSTGRSYSYNPGLRTATASIVKVDIVMALLLRAQRQRRGLTAGERRDAARAIQVSDNAAASALWSAIGGASGLAAANRRFGLRETRPDSSGAWGSTTTSAADQVRLLSALTSPRSPLSAKNRRYVLGLMGGVTPGQAWGVSASGRQGADVALKNGWLPRPRRMGGVTPGQAWGVSASGRQGADVALKNGWLPRPRHGGRWTVNSIGRVRTRGHTYLIAVISDRHGSMGAGVQAVGKVSRLVTETLARQD